ncbi:hypothetical protein NG895_06185 [Aeoliella sp. ICT_H6.2]|uniref:Uncharacterized protein n=1 Tax=Aeoliella straminimaris TaxID=2954799 RepID=A0A9X2F736_9BACT|nr:hypothetical protein [Aeoliella straminimaris]MCO6043490.1 hypothetical protein [Aeoliella straminimaris]
MDDENPFAAPQADLDPADFAIEGDPSVVRVDKKLRMPEGAQLPTRCVKCNRPAKTQWDVAANNGLSTRSGTSAILFVLLGAFLLIVFTALDISLLWLIPFVALAIGIVVWMERQEPRPVCTTFYVCPMHNLLRYVAGVPIAILAVLLLSSSRLTDWTGIDFETFFEFPRTLFLVLTANLMLMFAPHVIGKKLEKGYFEYHGFGEKYLKNFPTIEQQGAVFDEA